MLKDDCQPRFENLFLHSLPLSGVPYVPYHKTLLCPFHLLSSAIHLYWVVWPLCIVIDHEDITLNSRASAIIIICGLEELIILTWQQQWQRKMAMDLKVNLEILRLLIFSDFPSPPCWTWWGRSPGPTGTRCLVWCGVGGDRGGCKKREMQEEHKLAKVPDEGGMNEWRFDIWMSYRHHHLWAQTIAFPPGPCDETATALSVSPP